MLVGAYARRTVGDHNDKKKNAMKHNDDLVEAMDSLKKQPGLTDSPEEWGRWHKLWTVYTTRSWLQGENREKVIKHYNLAVENYSPTFMREVCLLV